MAKTKETGNKNGMSKKVREMDLDHVLLSVQSAKSSLTVMSNNIDAFLINDEFGPSEMYEFIGQIELIVNKEIKILEGVISELKESGAQEYSFGLDKPSDTDSIAVN